MFFLALNLLLCDRTPTLFLCHLLQPPPPQLFLGTLGAGITHKGSGISLFMFFPLEFLGPGVCAMPLQLVFWARCHPCVPRGTLEPKATCSVWVGVAERALVVALCEVRLALYF